MPRHSWQSRFGAAVLKRSSPMRHDARMGGDWWNPVDDVEAVASTVSDAWGTLKDTVPGLQPLSDAFDAVVTDPLRDFLSSPVGKVVGPIVMTAFASSAYMVASPHVGAQLAAATFALPGIARGDKDFVQAWTEEFVARVSALITYFVAQGVPEGVATPQVGQTFQQGFDACSSAFEQIADKTGIDFKRLANLAGVREDVAAEWLAQKVGDMRIVTDYDFDAKTGVGTLIPTSGDVMQKLAAQQMQAFLKAQAARRASVASALTKLSQTKSTVDLATRFIAPPSAASASAPELGPLTGVIPPSPAAATAAPAPPAGLSTGQKVGLGAAVAFGIGLLAKALALL